MKNRVCVVTGGNTGIGKAIVLALAQQQMQVAMVSRNKERGQTAVQDLLVTAPDAAIDLVVGDVGTIASTRQLAQDLLDRYANIHILINNAGIWPTKRILNEDGMEQSFMVNYLAPFMLDHLLYNRLKASAPARIVNVSAGRTMQKGRSQVVYSTKTVN